MMASGCATTPSLRGTESSIYIHGSRYLPLAEIAERHGMHFDWNAETQKITLTRDDLQFRLRVGSTVVVDSYQIETLKRPVLLHKGVVMVPETFTKLLSTLPPPSYRIHRVILDAGHGGEDSGAIGPMGLKEKQVTLDITRRLKSELEAQGLEVFLTREDDYFVSLYQRMYLADRVEGDFFVSLHCNASPDRQLDGFEVYHFDISYSSIELARSIAVAMEDRLPLANRGVRSARFFVLREAKMPAVLVEIGYLSNRAQEASLEERFYRQDVAEAIAEGILAYHYEFERRERFTE